MKEEGTFYCEICGSLQDHECVVKTGKTSKMWECKECQDSFMQVNCSVTSTDEGGL